MHEDRNYSRGEAAAEWCRDEGHGPSVRRQKESGEESAYDRDK
jgi:hypothetical protein